VGADNRVVLTSVTISRDLGKTLDAGSGLTAEDRVIEILQTELRPATKFASLVLRGKLARLRPSQIRLHYLIEAVPCSI